MKFKGKARETLQEAKSKIETLEQRMEDGEEEHSPFRRLMKEIRLRTKEIVR